MVEGDEMISIIVPLYNKEQQVEASLQSVLQQTWQDFEIVIVDDGSTDGSVSVVRAIEDSRIRIIQQTNAGVSAARNRGIEEAHGELIAFLDADDKWKPDYLATQMTLAEKYPQCDVFATNYEFRDQNGKVSPTIIRHLPFQETDGVITNYFKVASCSHPPLWTSAVMVRKSAIQSVGDFPVGVKSGEDLLTWARLAVRYKIAYSKTPGAIFAVEGYDVREKPKRVPAKDDVVGRELKQLAKEYSLPGLKQYVSHWHKMRSSIYMRLSMRQKSICEALKGLHYFPLNFKLYVYIVMNLLPSRLRPF